MGNAGVSAPLRVNRVDLAMRRMDAVEIAWAAGVITEIQVLGPARADWPCLIPGLVDAHVHIESVLNNVQTNVLIE